MSAQTANSHFSFQLPSMSYIDAKWEEPELRASAQGSQQHGRSISTWVARSIAAVQAWRLEQRTRAELNSMTDRELMDIGLNRSDIMRVFNAERGADLQARGQVR